MAKLEQDYFWKEDTVFLAKDMLGKWFCIKQRGTMAKIIITETEAYCGITDRASHAYGGRRTARTETMYAAGGCLYVYLCYGIHHLANVVTGPNEIPHAVLLRGGIMQQPAKHLAGPGILTKHLGIDRRWDKEIMDGRRVWMEENKEAQNWFDDIETTPRIGVEYAGQDALLPYRFCYSKNRIKHIMAVQRLL